MADAGPVEEVIDALQIVGTKRRISRCLPMVRDHADKLSEAGRPADAAVVVGAALQAGGAANELADVLFQHAEAAWQEEDWWTTFCETAGFERGTADVRRAWVYFDDMRSYEVGAVIFHAAGWGVGEVSAISNTDLEVSVTFQGGRKDRFPMRTAVEIFERLPENDLRTQALRDPDGLKHRIKKEPLEILKAILQRYGGKASNVTLRNALMQIGVTGNTWSSWWRKTRLLAENSEWFRVSGNATRAQVEILRRAVDPVEGLKRQMRNAPNLKEALKRVRDLLGGAKLEEEVRAAALESLSQLATDETQDPDQRMATWMLLREHTKQTPQALIELLRARMEEPLPVDPSTPPPVWAVLRTIPGAREQERSVELLEELYGETWIDEAAKHLAHATPGMIPPLLNALLADKRNDEIAAQYSSLLARPLRSPFVLIELARTVEDGKVTGDFPTPAQRAQALVELAVYLLAARRGNPLMTRAQSRLTTLLTKGKEPLLRRLLVDADIESMETLRAMLARGMDDKIETLLTDIALEQAPELFATDIASFWKEDRIWSTRAGLARREEELRVLRDVKLPENAEALGKAASYGDLSENSEWENAIEEQRHLTEQAARIESELRQVALLENAPITEGTVSPGSKVTYRDTASGEEITLRILGPWDTTEEGIVSYKAPLAGGMLGLNVGDKATITLPSGDLSVEILATEILPLS